MDPIVSSLISGLFGAVAAAIPVWAIARKQPSKGVQDTVALGGAYGGIITHLQKELARLSKELEDAREETQRAWDRVGELKREADNLQRRVLWLEGEVKRLGGDPWMGG